MNHFTEIKNYWISCKLETKQFNENFEKELNKINKLKNAEGEE